MRTTGKRGKPSRRVRLEDLARQCGVSVSTASRALAGGKGVRADLRARILDAAKTLNYAIPASIADRKVILAASSVAMIDYVRNQFTFYVLEGLNARAQSARRRDPDAADLQPGRGDRRARGGPRQ